MKNIGDPPFTEDKISQILSELYIVGIPYETIEIKKEKRKILDPECDAAQLQKRGIWISGSEEEYIEISVYNPVSYFHDWTLFRNWYYWVAVTSCNPVPLEDAIKLSNLPTEKKYPQMKDYLRVDGDCSGPLPKKEVSLYHIDTQEALNLFISYLKEKNVNN